tara:strand:- start:1604 stop:2908 length:1305 start_codon:yes stop_codon:yes gene_type:complete
MATDKTSSQKTRKKRATRSEKRKKRQKSIEESRKKHKLATGTLGLARRRSGENLNVLLPNAATRPTERVKARAADKAWLRQASDDELATVLRLYIETGDKDKIRMLNREFESRYSPQRFGTEFTELMTEAKKILAAASTEIGSRRLNSEKAQIELARIRQASNKSSVLSKSNNRRNPPETTATNSRQGWSVDEIELIVDDYFEMLEDEVNGRSINKAAHNRALLPKLNGRSRGSIEFKHCNISAVLSDSGRSFIEGYKPRPNVQNLLVEIVNEKWLASSFNKEKIAEPVDSTVDSYEDEIADMTGSELERVTRSIMQRRGQKSFRDKLLKAYGDRCAVTGDGPVDVLEAAHIEPYASSGLNHHTNGLLLRADIHTLFDLDLIRINPETLQVETTAGLNGSSYASLDKVKLRKRLDGQTPSNKLLRQRYESSAPR